MVGKLVLILLTLSHAAFSLSDVKFQLEYRTPSVFVGQQTKCEFVIYSTLDYLEVEVAKFPEFRGFWKENLLLRQGKISMNFEPLHSPPWRRVVIGSYHITPMLDEKSPKIAPMKLVIRTQRNPADSKESIVFSQEITPLTIKPLPKPNASQTISKFVGAVGKFRIRELREEVPFNTEEPVVVAFQLDGEGNYQELHQLEYDFPTEIEVASRRGFLQASSPYFSKRFEWTLIRKNTDDFVLSPVRFTFFNPTTETFETIESRPVRLYYEPPPKKLEEEGGPPPVELSLERAWGNRTKWRHSTPFALLQLVLGGCLFTLIYPSLRRQARNTESNAKDAMKEKIAKAERHWREGDTEAFLKLASEIVQLRLSQRDPRHAYSRTQLLINLRRSMEPKQLALAKAIFESYDSLAFSAEKKCKEDPSRLYEYFKKVANE